MHVVDLTPEYESHYFSCLEPWSEEVADRGDHKERWYARYRERGLVVKLAIDDDGEAVGMIQTLPVEECWIEGKGIDVVLCTWVHGHKEGVGNRQGRGAGVALLRAVEDDARARGRKGMAAWGLGIPVWMRASWYRRQGYERVGREGIAVLVFKAFTDDAVKPGWSPRRDEPVLQDGVVTVTAHVNGWCPAMSTGVERARRACACFPEGKVVFVEKPTELSDSVFINRRSVKLGPPPSVDKVRRKIDGAVWGSWWPQWPRR